MATTINANFVYGTGYFGIFSVNTGTDLNITTTGNVAGPLGGIAAINYATGALTINSTNVYGLYTGIVGVNRDGVGTGMGARLIFNTDVFCFASPFLDKPLP